jgi:hypothetical protein
MTKDELTEVLADVRSDAIAVVRDCGLQGDEPEVEAFIRAGIQRVAEVWEAQDKRLWHACRALYKSKKLRDKVAHYSENRFADYPNRSASLRLSAFLEQRIATLDDMLRGRLPLDTPIPPTPPEILRQLES